ncbi:MAG TPA: M23 family metallopeptidase [Patescibacteria group bacterium]|nr:M23 family metallopeptidase [Patescibacteria group bacterium]
MNGRRGLHLKRIFRSYNGRHFVSRWVRKLFDHPRAQQIIGYHLTVALAAVVIVEPTTHVVSGRQQLKDIPPPPAAYEIVTTTETTFAWPVQNPSITQGYRYGHRGIDVQSPERNIRPVDEGWVAQVNYGNWGYGNHVYIHHPHGRTSLYAHLATVAVKSGDTVTRETVIGTMGRTGWASGVHLHLEIYQDGETVNPIAVLPEL